MFADSQIVTGHPWGADALFLAAAILFVIVAIAVASRSPRGGQLAGVLTPAGLALVAVAFLIL